MVRGAFRKVPSQSSSPTRPPVSNVFFRPNDVPRDRRPYGLSDIMIGFQGKVYTPEGLFVQASPIGGTSAPGVDDTDSDDDYKMLSDDGLEDVGAAYEKQQDKKRRQWQKWSENVIPAMLKPYLQLLRETESLRSLNLVRNQQQCLGCSGGRMLDVSCIFFESK